jgi:hypothetical protein
MTQSLRIGDVHNSLVDGPVDRDAVMRL